MKVLQDRNGAVLVLRPDGPLTESDAKGFVSQARQAYSETLGRFVMDVSMVTFVDSAGLESLLDITEMMDEGGMALKLCGVNETLRQALELTGLAPGFEYYEDANAAARSFL
jgi:anti-anti-sigma factor